MRIERTACHPRPNTTRFVIGSGMGGLAFASIMAKLRQWRVLVLERHFKIGGFTHTFTRPGGWSWDVGLHYVGEMGEGMMGRRSRKARRRGGPRRHPCAESDVRRAAREALAQLDHGFFRVRLDRLTPRERDYLRAMAELGPGPYRSGEIAQLLGVKVTAVGPLRAGLIRKGMIYSQQHGETAFTVPMFDAFMKRSMPGWSPPRKVKARRPR